MFRRFYSQESDPPHKIMRYGVYYSAQLCFGFPSDRICQEEMICIGGVPVLKRHFGGAGPQIFYMIHRGVRIPRLDEIIFFLVSQFLLQVLSRSFASPPPFLDFSSFFPTPSRRIFPSFSGFTTQAGHLKRCT